jgi:hypothetical protein
MRFHRRALVTRRPPAGQNAADVAGIGDALDRRGGDVDDNFAKSLHEFDGIVDESGGQLGNEGMQPPG